MTSCPRAEGPLHSERNEWFIDYAITLTNLHYQSYQEASGIIRRRRSCYFVVRILRLHTFIVSSTVLRLAIYKRTIVRTDGSGERRHHRAFTSEQKEDRPSVHNLNKFTKLKQDVQPTVNLMIINCHK